MAHIYCITNTANGKQYVGKTLFSIEHRFLQHCKDSKKQNCSNRPLYKAMNKYGIDCFEITSLLECSPNDLSFYEQLFIEKLNTYHDGYNATKGGDGSILFNYEEIVNAYKKEKSIRKVAKQIGCCTDTISKVLKVYGIDIYKNISGSCKQKVSVAQINKDTGEQIRTFESVSDAARWLVDNKYAKKYNGGVRQKICNCCSGKLKTAYKFIWKYL